MEDFLKNELFIEHLSKLLSNIESQSENSENSDTNQTVQENKSRVRPEHESQQTNKDENEESSVLKVKVCDNFEKMSFQIKNAFEVSEKVDLEKENNEKRFVPKQKDDILKSNTSNLRRLTRKASIRERKQQFISSVIDKFNMNLKKTKQRKMFKKNPPKTPKIKMIEKDLLAKVGLGLSDMECFYIQNDLRVMNSQRQMNFQFFGKILGRKSDYYVVYGGKGVGLHGGKIKEPSIKERRQGTEPEGIGVNKYEIWVARHNRMVGSSLILWHYPNQQLPGVKSNFPLTSFCTGKNCPVYPQKSWCLPDISRWSFPANSKLSSRCSDST